MTTNYKYAPRAKTLEQAMGMAWCFADTLKTLRPAVEIQFEGKTVTIAHDSPLHLLMRELEGGATTVGPYPTEATLKEVAEQEQPIPVAPYEFTPEPGRTLNQVIGDAWGLAWLSQGYMPVAFTFYGHRVVVAQDTPLHLLKRDWDRLYRGTFTGTVGPYPAPEC